MSSAKIITMLIVLVIGIALGLAYGWLIDPVEYTDITPDLLRQDFKADYILMTAEAYQNDFNAEAAARRIALLGSAPPSAILSSTLEYAALHNFTKEETAALQALHTAMQTYQPNP